MNSPGSREAWQLVVALVSAVALTALILLAAKALGPIESELGRRITDGLVRRGY